MSIQRILQGMRVAPAVGLALPLGLFLLGWQFFRADDKVVQRDTIQGKVIEVQTKTYLVELDSGAQVRVFRTLELNRGEMITLIVDVHASGDKTFTLDSTGANLP